ncbi:hypothetical protein C4D60_Mb08t05530 [Musa balbisiana]|uniref:Uncharacterized protein n=1 Tax=Musa balbisiana TaxID=52838 RepID=A0A4V4H8R0_MUSBA|nr:hypothetical protein C4D60_Mb08t05530 [Musa balbisiana]
MLTWHDRVLVDFEWVPSKYRRAWHQPRSCASRCASERETEDQWEFTWAPDAMPGFPFPINIAEHWSATVAHGSHHRPHPPSFLFSSLCPLWGWGKSRSTTSVSSLGWSCAGRSGKETKQSMLFVFLMISALRRNRGEWAACGRGERDDTRIGWRDHPLFLHHLLGILHRLPRR